MFVRRGVDEHGWEFIECSPHGESGTVIAEVYISGEVIKVVAHKDNSVRVYINPDLDGHNELEATNGGRFHICKRKEPVPKICKLAANRPAATALSLIHI